MEAVHHDRENYFVTYIVKKKKKRKKIAWHMLMTKTNF